MVFAFYNSKVKQPAKGETKMSQKSGMKSALNFIDVNDYQRIHEASLKILAETGIVFQNDDAVEIFRKHGAKTDGQRVYMKQ